MVIIRTSRHMLGETKDGNELTFAKFDYNGDFPSVKLGITRRHIHAGN